LTLSDYFEQICLIFTKTNGLPLLKENVLSTEYKKVNSVQVAKTHLSFATAPLWHESFEITLKLYLYGKYSTQTMIFWSLCAFIWFRNMKKMLLQMTSVSLQPVPSL
jgi:hypothetical protein